MLVLDQRVPLSEATQVDAFAQVVHVRHVLAPAVVDHLQEHRPLEVPHELRAELLLALFVAAQRILIQAVRQLDTVDRVQVEVIRAEARLEDLVDLNEELGDVPLFHVVAGRVLLDQVLEHSPQLLGHRA